jgi:hypothetical protein
MRFVPNVQASCAFSAALAILGNYSSPSRCSRQRGHVVPRGSRGVPDVQRAHAGSVRAGSHRRRSLRAPRGHHLQRRGGTKIPIPTRLPPCATMFIITLCVSLLQSRFFAGVNPCDLSRNTHSLAALESRMTVLTQGALSPAPSYTTMTLQDGSFVSNDRRRLVGLLRAKLLPCGLSGATPPVCACLTAAPHVPNLPHHAEHRLRWIPVASCRCN